MKTYTTTLNKLFDIRQLINNNNIMSLAFSGKVALSIARNIKKMDDELTEYSKARDSLIQKYSDDGSSMKVSNPHWSEFAKELAEIGSVEVSIDINTITENELSPEMTPAACIAIEFMIEESVE